MNVDETDVEVKAQILPEVILEYFSNLDDDDMPLFFQFDDVLNRLDKWARDSKLSRKYSFDVFLNADVDIDVEVELEQSNISDDIIIPTNLYDELKVRILKEAFGKYSLDQLERRVF